jgi:hypothetical protein
LAAAYSVYSVVHHDWNSALWTGCVAIGVPCWLFAIKAPNTCGVITKLGHPCPNRSYGVLFGCGNAEGHTWAKFFAQFGWRRQPARLQTLGRSDPPPADRSVPKGGKISNEQRNTRDQIVFWSAIVATFAGLVSAATDLAGIMTK